MAMQQFEKWNKPYRLNNLALGDELRAKHKEQERKRAWKAALEWALSLSWELDCGTLGSPKVISAAKLKRELGNE